MSIPSALFPQIELAFSNLLGVYGQYAINRRQREWSMFDEERVSESGCLSCSRIAQ